MPDPILVGYDPKTADRAPVRFGVAAARFTDAPLVIASVVVEIPAVALLSSQADEDASAKVPELLREIRDELEAEGIPVETREVRSPSAPRGLHEAAEAAGAALLVVGSTQRGVVGRVLPGSTAERLMHGAPCPVAVVPHDWQPRGEMSTIGVAYVDTPEGGEALRGAHALARRAGATLRVITVHTDAFAKYAETDAWRAAHPAEPPRDVDDVEGEHRVMAERALREAVSDLGGDVEVDVDAFVGDPAEALIDVSQNLDLLVCGSRGYGPARAVLLGGVSRRVASSAHCPVIVLPRGVRASLAALVNEAPAQAPANG